MLKACTFYSFICFYIVYLIKTCSNIQNILVKLSIYSFEEYSTNVIRQYYSS